MSVSGNTQKLVSTKLRAITLNLVLSRYLKMVQTHNKILQKKDYYSLHINWACSTLYMYHAGLFQQSPGWEMLHLSPLIIQ